jgi:hypothetical protein
MGEGRREKPGLTLGRWAGIVDTMRRSLLSGLLLAMACGSSQPASTDGAHPASDAPGSGVEARTGDGVGVADRAVNDGALTDGAARDLAAVEQALHDGGPLTESRILDAAAFDLGGATDRPSTDQLRVARDMGVPSDSVGPPTGPICNADGWCWQNPLPQGAGLSGVWASDADHVWAVGGTGLILFWDGAGWAQEPSGTTQPLDAVWGTSARDIWAVGEMGAIVHFDGAAWSSMASPTTNALGGVWANSPNEAFATGLNATALHYTTTPTPKWSIMTTPDTSTSLGGVWGANNGDVWTAGVPGTAWNWNGSAWSSAMSTGIGPAFNMMCVGGTSANDVWVGGIPTVFHWDGVSGMWAPMGTGLRNPTSLSALTPNNVWAANGSADLFEWGGTSWATITTPISGTFAALTNSVFAISANDVWAVGSAGTIFHWDGSTVSYSPNVTSRVLTNIAGAWANSSTDVWAVAGNQVLHFDGTSWSVQTTLGANTLNAIWGTGGELWAVGAGGLSYHYKSGAWAPVATPTTNALNAVWGASTTQLWAAGNTGTVLTGDGTSWTQVAGIPTTGNLVGVWGSSAKDVWVILNGSVEIFLHWDGATWTKTTNLADTIGLHGIWGADSTHVWAVGAPTSGVSPILRWDGTNWNADDVGSTDSFTSVWGSSATDVWAVASDGRISHYNGTGWTLDTAAIPAQLTAVTGVGTSDVWVMGTTGTILHR